MKFLLCITVISSIILSCASKQSVLESKTSHSFEDFQKSYSLFDATISPDGKTIYYITNKEKYPMIWRYDLETKQENLFYDLGRPISSVSISQSGEYLVFEADQNGDENSEIFILPLKDKRPIDLSQRKGFRNGFCGFSDDGQTVTFMSNARNKSHFDIFKAKISTSGSIIENPKSFIQSDDVNTCGRFNTNNSQYTFVKFKTNTVQEIWTKDLRKNKLFQITPNEAASYSGASYLTGNNTVVTLSNLKTDFKNLVTFDLNTKKSKLITSEKWNIVQYLVDNVSHLAAYVTNEDGVHKLKLSDENFKNSHEINLPIGVVKVFGWEYKKAKNILLSIETAKQPNELYVYNLKEKHFQKITHLNQSPVPEEEMVDTELIKIKSDDGLEFSSWLLKPNPKKNNGIGIVMVHGGPEDQVLPSYSHYRQFLADQGFTVIMPNFRGSTGYGTKFQKMVYGDWGGGHIKDVMASRQYLIDQVGLDKNKISVLGGSFGGFSVLSSITQHPESYCAAVDFFGPSNLFNFLSSMPPHWKTTMYELVGDPEKDKEKLTRVSPYFSLDKIKSPLLVIQGANDPRIVKKESDQVVEKLKSLGRTVDYIVFDDEGHGFSKNENQVKAFVEASKHLRRYCGGNN